MIDCDEWNHHDLDDIYGFSPGNAFVHYSFKNRIIFQQFTGLLDSAGKETYEGDIIKINSYLGTIEFGEFSDNEFVCHYGFFINWDDSINLWDNGFNEKTAKDLTVVGNLFENPELIEKQ